MYYLKFKRIIGLVVLLTMAALSLAAIPAARAGDNDHSPDLPSPICDTVDVPNGQKLSSHLYALGVQIYRWNGDAWVFVEPQATLFADADYHSKVGIHYVGPTWESNSGSKVVAARLAGCSPDTANIPWLLLNAVSADGPGPFGSVTYIQRVNTAGGLAPIAPGVSIGALAQVPYTAEYYFYRAKN